MPTIDFHGCTVEEAVRDVNKLVDDARMDGATYQCYFITGEGKIKQRLIELLKNYGFRVFAKQGNLKVEIE